MLRYVGRNARTTPPLRLIRQIHQHDAMFKTYNSDDVISGYKVVNKANISKLGMTTYELVHEGSGARHIHAARDDTNKVFAIGFHTQPPDHTGLPHILEHTTLCGSHKFPVRDPFFKMLTRSLANYMNALTGVDYTFYPFATTNSQDYANLQSVYLDAVFDPLLRKSDFRQEGWRLEFDKTDNPNSPLVYKGVVFNEMKGQMSNPAYLFYIRFFQTIYPNLQFAGGDPAHITNLTFEDLVAFHNEKYHPSNCVSFSYGSMDLQNVLDPLKAQIDQKMCQTLRTDSGKCFIPEPLSLTENLEIELEGPEDPTFDGDQQYKVSLSWIAGDSANLEETIAWKVLGTLLTEGHASPFYKALIDTGIASDFSVNTGLEDTPAKNIFTIGVQGMPKANLEKFKVAVMEVLENVAVNGIDKERVAAVLNQADLADREVDANFGMDLVSRLFPRVFNSTSYLKLLDNEALLTSFRSQLTEEPDLFQRLVKERLVTKPYLQFAMVPSATYEDKLAKEEQSSLRAKVEKLTENDKVDIFDEGIELQKAQQATEDVSVLPTLFASDISKDVVSYPLNKLVNPIAKTNNIATIYTRETATQGITYINILRNLSRLPSGLINYLPLFTSAVSNVGTSNYAMDELEEQIKLNTGGVNMSLLVRSLEHDDISGNASLDLVLGGSALETKVAHVYRLLDEMVCHADFSKLSKLKPLIAATAQNAMTAISDGGHRYAMAYTRAGLSSKSRTEEALSGLEQMRFIISLSKMSDSELLKRVVPKLDEIRSFVVNNCLPTVAGITSTQSGLSSGVSGFEQFAARFPMNDDHTMRLEPFDPITQHKSHFLLPFQVSYVGASISGAPYASKSSAALQILANILTHRYLHKEIREKGGAYGGGASYSALDSTLSFYSYRDPNPLNTIETISRVKDWISSYGLGKRELEEAKLSVFQGIDAPISPRSEITYEFLYGLTQEKRQARRNALLDVSVEDCMAAASEYLHKLKNLGTSSAPLAVLGPPHPSFSKENGWQLVDPEGDL